MTNGTKVICNGHQGTVVKVHDGQLTGLVDVRLGSGTVCVDASELIRLYEHKDATGKLHLVTIPEE